MGATYLSMQLRTTNRDDVVAELRSLAAANAGAGLQFYVAEPRNGWLPVFPNFTPEMERVAKAVSARVDCLVVLLLSADEDDLYCMFFRAGKQLPWFKVGVGRSRRGKERATDVTFSSDLLRALCEIAGIQSAFTSFDYLQRGEREGLNPPSEPELISGREA